MQKFLFTVGTPIQISYKNFLGQETFVAISPQTFRDAIKPAAIHTLMLFHDEEDAKAYADYVTHYARTKLKHYPKYKAAVYTVYIFDLSGLSEEKTQVITKPERSLSSGPVEKEFSYWEIKNDELNILVFDAMLNDTTVQFIPHLHEKFFLPGSDTINGIIALLEDYYQPARGFIPKKLLNYHFTDTAQELVKKIQQNPDPKAVQDLLQGLRKDLYENSAINRIGSFTAAVEFALQQLNKYFDAQQQAQLSVDSQVEYLSL